MRRAHTILRMSFGCDFFLGPWSVINLRSVSRVKLHASCTQHRPFSARMGAIVTIIWATCFLPGLLAFVPTCFWFILFFVVSPDSKTQMDNETGLALRRLRLRCSGRCMVALIIMALGLPETYLWPNMISLEITIK